MKQKTKIIISVLIIILALGVWAGWYYWWRLEPVRQALNIHETELARLQSDTIGGSTPEETWQMFLTALRAEDLDLASKYFVLSKQEENKEWFEKVKEKGLLDEMMQDLTVAPWQVVSPGEFLAEYEIKNAEGETTAYIIMEKNINHKWKIRSL